jgi:phage shock protein C
MRMTERLYRSAHDRVIAGVAGGLGRAWNVDPTWIRVGWVALVPLTSGLALLVYAVMAVVVPEEPTALPTAASRAPPGNDRATIGDELDSAHAAETGAPPLAEPRRGPDAGTGSLIVGALLVLGGVYFLVRDYLPPVEFDRVWPIAIIVAGAFLLFSAMRRRPPAGGDR